MPQRQQVRGNTAAVQIDSCPVSRDNRANGGLQHIIRPTTHNTTANHYLRRLPYPTDDPDPVDLDADHLPGTTPGPATADRQPIKQVAGHQRADLGHRQHR